MLVSHFFQFPPHLQQQPLLLPLVQVRVALSARIFLISQISSLLPNQLNPCKITKWPDFQGYGFNLHAERDRVGQFIGEINDDSPADAASLKEGDIIIEVNGTNIENFPLIYSSNHCFYLWFRFVWL
jgi:Na(+)/H(+) exchange regulatory cofactor NHE-RF1